MKINDETFKHTTLEEFADKYDLTLDICERESWSVNRGNHRFYVDFDSHVWHSDSGVLRGLTGNGNTKDKAIRDYVEVLSGKKLAINPFVDDKRIDVEPLHFGYGVIK